ncbi:hypothetical protein ExPEC_4111 [Escherichia coli]|uniref:Uncharacterized protein n=1 Tax=Escherichia coli TaxID=562 RepID=A0A0D8W9X8_ECOLX|nr:hypothetical protein [Escherichia coli]EFO1705133.1 hypothetical protein [Escherichia coli]EFO2378230.1 hypothetical protein [Escherichia coli]EFO2690330.1 hypothetical protein [Escherichia coli]KJH06839.1 hypothetical protein UC41_15850 [Escherichia coli]
MPNRSPPFLTAYVPKITTQLFTLLYARVSLATSLQDSGQFTSSNATQT